MVYVVADIHGEYDLFLKLLDEISFSESDEIIVCGDMIDKGEKSVKLLQLLYQMPNATCLLGNHEYSFLKHYWALMKEASDDYDGVLQDLQGYFSTDGHLLNWELIDWLESLPYYVEREHFICVHAGIATENEKILPLGENLPEHFLYDRRFKDPHFLPITDKCIFFGHTPTSYVCDEDIILTYLNPRFYGENSVRKYAKIHLDTGVWLNGKLGCFCVDTLTDYYVTKE